MKSSADLLALLLAAMPTQGGVVAFQGVVGPQEPQNAGPRGSSQPAHGEARLDLVEHAAVTSLPGVAVAAPGLATGEVVEVTSLESGRTIVARVEVGGPGLAISPAAAAALGITGSRAALRVRRVVATPRDASALMRGEEAAPRADAPPALLAALRHKLGTPKPAPAGAQQAVARQSNAAFSAVTPSVAPAPRTGIGVQVAALSNLARARTLASQLGGQVASGGGLHRVQLGPFATRAQAEAARAVAARRGYRDARLITVSPQ